MTHPSFTRGFLTLSLFLVLTIARTAAQAPPPAQAMRSVWIGVYSDAQAARGADVYTEWCARCHGKKLEGDGEYGRPLAGDEFLKSRNNSPLSALFSKIFNAMPDDDPGKITPQQSADLVAYILSVNKIPAGKDDMPTDMNVLRQINIEATKPKLPSTHD